MLPNSSDSTALGAFRPAEPWSRFMTMDTMKVELLELFGEGESACTRFEVDSKTAKGRHWKGDYVAVFHIVDDKIQSAREYFDTKRLIEVVFD